MTGREEKRAQFEGRRKRNPIPWILAVVMVVAIAGAFGWMMIGPGGKYPQVRPVQGRILIPVNQISDGRAHFFTYRSGSTPIHFFVLQSQDGVLRAALDTCDVCYQEKKGYRQEGDLMVCNNCDQKFRSDLINVVKGGCNPAPLERAIEGDHLIIAASELEKGAWYFR